MDELFASIQQDLAGLANRLAAVEARLDRLHVASLNPERRRFNGSIVDYFPPAHGPNTQVIYGEPMEPVEPAPQAPQGVTVEELANTIAYVVLRELPVTKEAITYKITVALWNDPRIGPLLRGEGAPAAVPVVLPEEPPFSRLPYVEGPSDEEALVRAVWASARAEVARQQGGQDHE